MIPENNLLPLNDTEHFLKNFLKKFPVYQTKIINPLENEPDYIYLLHLLETEWHKQLPDQTFFLTGSSGHLSEDFFIPENQNVCILKNLRYMPLLMHSHQFIEINYVLKSDHSLLIDPPHFRMEILFYVLQTFSTHFKRKIKTASLLISFCVSQHLILFSFIY